MVLVPFFLHFTVHTVCTASVNYGMIFIKVLIALFPVAFDVNL